MWLQNAYLYYRMYYSKLRDTAQHWWRTYLLCKCCVLVIPVYSLLLAVGLYCIVYNIDVQSPIKTVYELLLLVLSAVAIFILVLLLATLNGIYNRNSGDNAVGHHLETAAAMVESISASRRNRRTSADQPDRPAQTSLASSIMSTLFGTYDDPDDPDGGYDSDELSSLDIQTAAAVQQLDLLDQEALHHLLDVDQQYGAISSLDVEAATAETAGEPLMITNPLLGPRCSGGGSGSFPSLIPPNPVPFHHHHHHYQHHQQHSNAMGRPDPCCDMEFRPMDYHDQQQWQQSWSSSSNSSNNYQQANISTGLQIS